LGFGFSDPGTVGSQSGEEISGEAVIIISRSCSAVSPADRWLPSGGLAAESPAVAWGVSPLWGLFFLIHFCPDIRFLFVLGAGRMGRLALLIFL
jgi:hypothetical protein